MSHSFYKCPRCEDGEFEVFSKYGICHDCNYFDVKGIHSVSENFKKIKTNNTLLPFRLGKKERNQFTEEDYGIVRKALLSISKKEQKVVFLFFWMNETKSKIAERMDMSCIQVERILESAYQRLKGLCLQDSKFSRFAQKLNVA